MRLIVMCLVMLGPNAGCLPLSVHPLYVDEDDVVFDDALLGPWQPTEDDGEWGIWTFTRSPGSRRYELRIADAEGRRCRFEAALVRLGNRRFLDLLPREVEPDIDVNPMFAMHLMLLRSFVRVEVREDGQLSLGFVDGDAIDEALETEPEAIAHVVVPTGDGPARIHRLMFTADSAALQAFVRHRLDDETYFAHRELFMKARPADPARPRLAPATQPAEDETVLEPLYD